MTTSQRSLLHLALHAGPSTLLDKALLSQLLQLPHGRLVDDLIHGLHSDGVGVPLLHLQSLPQEYHPKLTFLQLEEGHEPGDEGGVQRLFHHLAFLGDPPHLPTHLPLLVEHHDLVHMSLRQLTIHIRLQK